MFNKTNTSLKEKSYVSTYTLSFYAFLLVTFILIARPQDVYPSIQLFRPVLFFSLINLILVCAQGMNPITIQLKQSISRKYVYLYGLMLLGIPFAIYRRGAFEFAVFQYSINILYMGLFILHVNSYKRLRALLFTLVFSVLFFGMASQSLGGIEAGRYSFGEMFDPNDLAYVFVSLMPFSVIFILERGNTAFKIMAMLTIGISIKLILSTGSRGGFIGLIIILGLFFVTKLSPFTRPIKFILCISILFITIANKEMIFNERISSLMNIGKDYNITDEEGRLKLWGKGVEFAIKRPFTGIGAQCFPAAIGLNRKQMSGQERWQAIHNSYLEIASELGLIAFVIFILMIKESFKVFKMIRKIDNNIINAKEIKMIASVTLIAFIGHLVTALFLSQGYSILFTLFFALTTVLNILLAMDVMAPSSTRTTV